MVGSKSYLTVAEIHDAATISPVAAMYLAAGVFCSGKMTTLGFDKPCCCMLLLGILPQSLFFVVVKMTTLVLRSPVAARSLAAGAFF